MAIESGRARGNWTFKLFGRRFGFEYSPIIHGGNPYMYRWILYLCGWTLRVHKIMRPDHDRALHNHPFAFMTVPTRPYVEIYWDEQLELERTRIVPPWRPSIRGITFRHRIVSTFNRPVVTFVISGPYRQKWGFFPTPDTFVPWKSTSAEEPLS